MPGTTDRLLALAARLRPARSLRTRVAWVTGGTGLVLAVLLIAVADRALRSQAVALEGRVLEIEARMIRRSIETAMLENLHHLRGIATHPLFASGPPEPGETRLLLESLRGQEPAFAWIAIADVQGRVQVATGTLGEGARLRDDRSFQQSRKAPWIGARREAGFLEARMGLVDGRPPITIDLGVPLVDSAGRATGVVLGRVRGDWLESLHASLRSKASEWPGTESVVLDRDGNVVAGARQEQGFAKVSFEAGVALDVEGWQGRGEYVTASSPSGDPAAGLSVLVRRPTAIAFRAADEVRAELLVLGVGVIGGFILLSSWLAHRFARPIQELSEAALRVVRNEPPRFAAMNPGRNDEIAQLARALQSLHCELSMRLVEKERAAERFRALFRDAPGAILVFRNQRVVMANEACRGLFGVPRAEELLGRDAASLVHPVDRPGFLDEDALAACSVAGERAVAPESHRIVRLDGTVAYVESTTTPVALDEGTAIQVAMRDVTAQREAQALLLELNEKLEQRVGERTAELTSANAELDAFAYAVSHDLRGPLRAVRGYAQVLLDDHGGELGEETKEFLGRINAAGQRMTELVEGLLTLSRSARAPLETTSVDLSALCEAAISELRHLEPQREVHVEIEPGIVVDGDACMLAAAVANLLGNAWKYTAGRDHASIEVATEERAGERWVRFRDNGAGFDPAHAGRLYQPFARMHRQDEFPGLGIGLATVARIVKRHGARIEAESAPGRGACFRICFPTAAARGAE